MKNSVIEAQNRMEGFTHEFPMDLKTSIEIANNNPIRLKKDQIKNIVICGMGGSGIGGMIAKDLLSKNQKLPIDFCKGYILPEYVNATTLVICSSYSGNTEETLSLFDQAKDKDAQLISICSGGKLEQRSRENNFQWLKIPGGKQPRAAVGLSLIQQLHILGDLFLSADQKQELFSELASVIQELITKREHIQQEAIAIAEKIDTKNILLFTETPFSSIATRFTQQINENVKKRAHAAIIPEMNHNELVAFVDYTEKDAVLLVNTNLYSAQNTKRTQFMKEKLEEQNTTVIEVNQDSQSIESVFLKSIYLLDLVSIELSKKLNVNPEEVEIIESLKVKIAH
jgi:glucose/mannose-6-phosphate isomerase